MDRGGGTRLHRTSIKPQWDAGLADFAVLVTHSGIIRRVATAGWPRVPLFQFEPRRVGEHARDRVADLAPVAVLVPP